MTPHCDGTRVGLIIEDQDRLLLIRYGVQPRWPIGHALVAGHLCEHADDTADIADQVRDLFRLPVSPELVWQGHLPDVCAHLTTGHDWWLYRATGDLRPDVAGAAWATLAEIRALADRTIAHAYEWFHGWADDAAYEATPGLEAVWVHHLAQVGLLVVSDADLRVVRGECARRPSLERRAAIYGRDHGVAPQDQAEVAHAAWLHARGY